MERLQAPPHELRLVHCSVRAPEPRNPAPPRIEDPLSTGHRRARGPPGLASVVVMSAAVFFGCAFIAFGPALSLYVFTIAIDPLRVIFLIAG